MDGHTIGSELLSTPFSHFDKTSIFLENELCSHIAGSNSAILITCLTVLNAHLTLLSKLLVKLCLNFLICKIEWIVLSLMDFSRELDELMHIKHTVMNHMQ